MTASDTASRFDWFRRLLAPPRFVDEEKTRTARLLNAILLAAIALAGVRVIIGLIESGLSFWTGDIVLVGLMAVMAALLVIMRRGYVQATNLILLGLLWVAMVYVAAGSEGIHDGAFTALAAVIVTASLLMSWKASAIVAALSIAAGWWLASQYAGKPQVLGPSSASDYARDTSIIFTLLVVLMYLVVNNLRQALDHSKASEQNLRRQNIELTTLRASLEERVAERTGQLAISVEVGRVAASILDPNRLLDEIVQVIADRFDFYYVAVFTLSTQRNTAVLRAATGEAGRLLKEGGHKLPLGVDSMVGYAITKRKSRLALDVGKDAVHFANPLLPETRSEIALPLIVGDSVLGALDVQSTQASAFDEGNVAVLQNMANQIAIALANAQSFERVQQSLQYTKRQFEVGRALFAAQTTQDAYMALGQAWALLASVDRLQIYLVASRDSSGLPSDYELAMEWDVLAGVQINLGRVFAASDVPIVGIGKFDRMVVISDVNDPQVERSSRAILLQAGAQSALLVPVHIREQFAGMLVAAAERPTEYSEAELNLVAATADQLALVLDNLRLTFERQETLQHMEQLNRQLSGEAWQYYLSQQHDVGATSGQALVASDASRLELPIQVRGQAVGAFALEDADPNRQWKPEELTLFQTIANEVALAIDNARLIEQTQRAAQREKAVASAADKIHRSTEIDGVLHTAVAELNRITGRRGISIQLGFSGTDNRQKQPSQNMTRVENSSVSAAGDGQSAEA